MRATPWFVSSAAGIFYCTWTEELQRLCGWPGGWPAVVAVLVAYLYQASIATWIVNDARRTGHTLPYDYGSLVFVFTVVFAPVYLFSRRGLRGFIPIGAGFLLSLAGVLCAMISAALLQGLRQFHI